MHAIRLLAIVFVLALVGSACGGGRSSSDDAATATATATEEATAAEADPPDSASAEATEEATAEAVEPEVAMFGDAPWPCAPGDASGATDQGVTTETIKVGVGDDRGFPTSPGLNKDMTDALVAMIDVCNELGGINGRLVEPVVYDAAVFNAGQVVIEACDQVFKLVGEGWSLDTAAEPDRVACDLAAVPAWSVSADFAHGPFSYQPLPNPADQQNYGHGWIMENVVAAELGLDVSNSASAYGNYAATEQTWEKIQRSWVGNTGFEFPTTVVYNVAGEDDWTPFTLQLKSAGADVVYFSGSCFPQYQGLRQSGVVNDYDAIYTTETNFYSAECAEANTDGAMDGTYIRMSFVPLEEAEHNKATADFLEIVEAAGVQPSILGVQAVSAFLLWARAANGCGAELTRECVLEQVATVREWTGHGLHLSTDPASNDSPRCLAIVVLEGTEYKRVYPEEPATFACPEDVGDEEWVVTIETAASQAALLDENRVSTKYTGGG